MKKSILEIYALAVCFVTVICFVISLGITLYGIIGITNPDFTISSSTYTEHQTNDDFWNSSYRSLSMSVNPGEAEKARSILDEALLSKQRENSFARILANERRDNTQTVVKTLIVILIDAVVFLLHWFIARRARADVI